MGQRTLEELRSDLVDAFKTALDTGRRYSTSAVGPENLKAAAELAKAIVKIDDKIDSRNEARNGMKLPGKG